MSTSQATDGAGASASTAGGGALLDAPTMAAASSACILRISRYQAASVDCTDLGGLHGPLDACSPESQAWP